MCLFWKEMSKQPSRAGKDTKKSKEVKGKPVSSEKLPTALFEIVPGKFNETDWYFINSKNDNTLEK